jgi:hypothetical protein
MCCQLSSSLLEALTSNTDRQPSRARPRRRSAPPAGLRSRQRPPLDDAGLWWRLATALARPGRHYTAGDVATLLDTAADYLIETVITGQAAYYRLYHQALSDRLRERDQQHPRPVSAAQTVYQSLLDTVAVRPDGTLDWPAAHPYLHNQLAGHAADVGQLPGLVDDPEFLAAADPAEVFAVLKRPGQPLTGNAQIYRHAYPDLRPGANATGVEGDPGGSGERHGRVLHPRCEVDDAVAPDRDGDAGGMWLAPAGRSTRELRMLL